MSEEENIIKKYMRVTCPGCQEKLQVETQFSLKKHECEKCGANFYVPEVFGNYQLLDTAANDETTSTHHGLDIETGKPAVIRRLRKELKLNGAVKKVFFEETNRLRDIKIDCVIKAAHCGDINGVPYLVYAHYGVDCLKRKIRKEKFTLGQASYMFLDILNAVEVCHEQSLVHGNLKPSNIRYDEMGNIRLLDFGMTAALIKCLMAEKKDIKLYSNPFYIAPETVKSGELTPVSEIYSLGSIFYEMVTGQKPFGFMNPLEAMVKKQLELPEPPNHLKPGIPPTLNSLIMGMIDINPARRPQFIVQVVAIIQKVLEELDEKPPVKATELDEKELPLDSTGGYVQSTMAEKNIPVYELPTVGKDKKFLEQYGFFISIVFVLIFVIVILLVVFLNSP